MTFRQKVRRITLFFVALFVLTLFFACGKKESPPVDAPAPAEDIGLEAEAQMITVFFPVSEDEEADKWLRLEKSMKDIVSEMKYEIQFVYEGDDETQAYSVVQAVERGTECVIIAPVNSYSTHMMDALKTAKEKGVPTILLDSLVMNTEYIDCFVTFDKYLSGRLLAEHALSVALAGGRTIEFFMESENLTSAKYFYHGVMDVIQPAIDRGAVTVPSGRVTRSDTAVETERAARLVSNDVSLLYEAADPPAVICGSDTLAYIVRGAFNGIGKNPSIGSVGCERDIVIDIRDGARAVSVFEDEREMAKSAIYYADYLISRIVPDGLERVTFDNGAKVVPTAIIPVQVVARENYVDTLLISHYYYKEDLE